MQVINIFEAKTQLSKLVQVVERGGEVIIGRYGQPVAKLVPYVPARPQYRFGGLAGALIARKDFDDAEETTISAVVSSKKGKS